MKKIQLNGIWDMACGDGRHFPARVPGSVLQTLQEQGDIPDPFDGMNEYAARERTRRAYTFSRLFSVDAEMLRAPHADLVFGGLDTLAEIRLNGRTLIHADNMHRTWRIPVRDMLREGENRLEAVFSPALDAAEAAARQYPEVTYTGGSELAGSWALRKAHYMFGWDWGPCLPDAGIWRDIRLEVYEHRLEEIRIRQAHGAEWADVFVTAMTGAERTEMTLTDPDGVTAAEAQAPAGETAALRVSHPRLWWPNGLGEQPLYTLRVRAAGRDGTTEDEAVLRIGLRTLGVSREKDEWGEEFALQCNGVKFFAMGADYIPEDSMPARMSRGKTESLLKDCRDAHFNTLRVWGGGFYPGDDFFDLCDEMGLVVWQDLMFACNTYRLTEGFGASIREEAKENLRRIRHHACLGLICGNNEMETAWTDWGSVRDQAEDLKQDYLEQFEGLLKDVCRQEAPDVFYWPSSPSSGGGFDKPNDLDRGDVHDWSVWHGRRPFSDFTERYPRFCSEFGFESFPCMETLRSFIHEDREMNPFSRTMESHQKCRNGNATMLYYLSQTLRYPFSMEKLVHASQYLQAEAVRAGVEHWRRNRGRCMGAIYWQLNDCWPVASWSGIDSFGRWKALHYAAKRFFAPAAVSLRPEGDGAAVYLCNERREPFCGKVVLRERDERGMVIRETVFPAECPAMGAVRAGETSGKLPAVTQALLQDERGRTVHEAEMAGMLPKHFPFEKPRFTVECEGRVIRLTADAFCLGTELEAGDARFSDNWVAMYPGETREITADRELKPEDIRIRCVE